MARVDHYYHGKSASVGIFGTIAGIIVMTLGAAVLDDMDPNYEAKMEAKARVEAAAVKARGEDSVTFPASLGRFPDITPSLVASYGGKCVNGGVYVTYTDSDGKLYDEQRWEPCK